MKRGTFLTTAMSVGILLARATLMATPVVQPEARAQTAPVPHKKDAADDPAVWIHPTQPELSLLLGTDKQGGLHSYNLDGSPHELVSDGTNPNNVDVLYGFKLDGRAVDVAVASVRGGKKATGVKVWAIDPATRRLTDVTDSACLRVLGGKEPMGICGYRSANTGRSYFFVTSQKGEVEQYELKDAGNGKIKALLARMIKLSSIA